MSAKNTGVGLQEPPRPCEVAAKEGQAGLQGAHQSLTQERAPLETHGRPTPSGRPEGPLSAAGQGAHEIRM